MAMAGHMKFAVSLCLMVVLAEQVQAATEHEKTLGSLLHDITEIEMGLEGNLKEIEGVTEEIKGSVEKFKTEYNWFGIKLMRAGVPFAVVETEERGFKVMETLTAIQEQVLDKATDTNSMINALDNFWPTFSKTLLRLGALIEASGSVARNALSKACPVAEDKQGSTNGRLIFLQVQFPMGISLMLQRLQKTVKKGDAEFQLSPDARAKLDRLVQSADDHMKMADHVSKWLKQAKTNAQINPILSTGQLQWRACDADEIKTPLTCTPPPICPELLAVAAQAWAPVYSMSNGQPCQE